MENLWVTIGAAVIGALLGALATAWFTRREAKRSLRIDAAKGILSFLALVLNRSAPEIQAENAEALKHEWAVLNRGLYLVSVPENARSQLDERVVGYLKGLDGLRRGVETRDEVERLRDLAKTEARRFLSLMGMTADW